MTEIVNPDPGFWTKTALIQLGYGVWVSMTMVAVGLAMGFPAVTIPQLNDKNSDIKMTTSDEGWIASVLSFVAPIGCLVCGYLMDNIGRRLILIMCELPLCLGWLYTGFATTARDIIIGRVITGVGMGMAMGAPRIFITEISLPNMRGTVGALPNLAISLGLIFLAIFGSFLSWTTLCHVCGAYSLFLFFLNMFLPETPYFALLKGTDESAETALKKFRSETYQTDKEIDDMLEYKAVNNIRSLTFREQICLLFTKAACKPFCIIFTYILFSQISGVTIIFMWTIELIEGSMSSVDANVGNMVMGLARFFTGILSSILLYRIGRKPQALVSSVGVGIMFIALGSYIHAKSTPGVFPIIAYVSVVFFATIGYYTLPLLIMYELYPLQVRGLLGGLTVSLLMFCMFGANKLYPYLRNSIGHANVLFCFGVSSLLASIFLFFYMPETKGLTLQEIEEYFNDRRATLVSQKSVIAAQLSGSVRNFNVSVARSGMNLKHVKADPEKDILHLKKKLRNSRSLVQLAPPSDQNEDENQETVEDSDAKKEPASSDHQA
ncbi:hypothetical protein ABMA28_015417 [Loxostege sticticalis]|uniref:Major facilitator superfamily (MFS) profile domain-containing protein n=1 Tax=Loxostege sticticalis TaxID=481309 RepID=A0ABD0T9Z2_LOXSC